MCDFALPSDFNDDQKKAVLAASQFIVDIHWAEEKIRNGEFEFWDDVSADLEGKTFTQLELFRHCLKTCKRLFEISEFQYGKKAENIPSDFIEDITL